MKEKENTIFNLNEEYKISDNKDFDVVKVMIFKNKELNKFNFDWDFQKPISLFFNSLSIKNFCYENSFWLQNIEFKKLVFDDVKFLKSSKSDYADWIDFLFCDNYKTLDKLRISYLNKSIDSEWRLWFYHFKIKDFIIEDVTLLENESITRKNTEEKTYYHSRKKSFIKEIKISNPVFLEKFSIKNLNLWTLRLENINSTIKSFQLNDFTINHLIIKNSDLSNAQFNWLRIKKLTILNSNLQNCIFNWVNLESYDLWDEISENDWNDLKTYKLSTLQLRDNYRQLKFVMDKNWNHTEANKFYAKEMEYYWKTLSLGNDSLYTIINNLFEENFTWKNAAVASEKITLLFSSFVSDFWNNWIQPAFILFVIWFLATIIHLAVEILTILTNNSIYWNILFIILICVIIFIDYKSNKQNNLLSQLIDKSLSKIWFFIIFVFSSFFVLEIINIYFSIKQNNWLNDDTLISILKMIFIDFNFHSLSVFWNYLNPIWLLPEFTIIDWQKYYITYNWIELLAFVLYKIIYGILLWHLIVAAKRTTRR